MTGPPCLTPEWRWGRGYRVATSHVPEEITSRTTSFPCRCDDGTSRREGGQGLFHRASRHGLRGFAGVGVGQLPTSASGATAVAGWGAATVPWPPPAGVASRAAPASGVASAGGSGTRVRRGADRRRRPAATTTSAAAI